MWKIPEPLLTASVRTNFAWKVKDGRLCLLQDLADSEYKTKVDKNNVAQKEIVLPSP